VCGGVEGECVEERRGGECEERRESVRRKDRRCEAGFLKSLRINTNTKSYVISCCDIFFQTRVDICRNPGYLSSPGLQS